METHSPSSLWDHSTYLKELETTPDFLVYHFYPQGPSEENDAQLLQASSTVADSAVNLRKMITDYFGAAKLLTHWGRHGDAVLGATSSSPLLAAHAARLADGRLALLVINKSPTTDLAACISLSQFLPGSTDAVIHQYAKANDLAGADLTSIPITNASESFTATLPSYSMNVIVLAAPQGFSAW